MRIGVFWLFKEVRIHTDTLISMLPDPWVWRLCSRASVDSQRFPQIVHQPPFLSSDINWWHLVPPASRLLSSTGWHPTHPISFVDFLACCCFYHLNCYVKDKLLHFLFFWIPPIEALQCLINDFVGIFCKEQDKENIALTQNPNIRSQTKISKTAACLCKNDTSNQPTHKQTNLPAVEVLRLYSLEFHCLSVFLW